MKKQLFIYLTSAAGIQQVNRGVEIEFINNFNNQTPFYVISKKQSVNTLKSCSESAIAILIHDSIDKKTFFDNLKHVECNFENIYIAYHSSGLNEKELNECESRSKFIIRYGSNLPTCFLYTSLLNFINSDHDAINKTLLAFNGDPELNSNLALLHKCLNPNELKNLTEDDYSHLLSNQDQETVLAAFISDNKNKSDPFDSSYIQALTTLRTKLLTKT